MHRLNYKHLHYFWVVAKSGGVAKAGERLHVAPQSISGQMRLLEAAVGSPLWGRSGRKLELTETGHLVFDYADRLFTVGEELQAALRERPGGVQTVFRAGVADVVVKSLAYRMLQPALALDNPPRLSCREGRLAELLSHLAVHRLDLVLSDRPMHSSMNVRGFNHLLGECGVVFLAAPVLARRLHKGFPASLDGAPFLMPGEDSAVRARLTRWFDRLEIRPRVVAEFDDTALLKAFAQAGAGVFAMPALVAEQVAVQFHVSEIGRTDEVIEQVYAITGERRLTHPAVVAINRAAHSSVFADLAPRAGAPAGAKHEVHPPDRPAPRPARRTAAPA
jgi:LysR family transcriptional activator of nhaA